MLYHYLGGSDGIYRGSRPHPRGCGTFARIVGDYVRADTLGLEGAPDVIVFDPAALADHGTWRDGRAAPSGIVHVLVNGEPVVRQAGPLTRLI